MSSRARTVNLTIHKHVLGTDIPVPFLSGAGALHVQLHMDDVIGLIVDDVIIFLY